jgi:hypothetical protein
MRMNAGNFGHHFSSTHHRTSLGKVLNFYKLPETATGPKCVQMTGTQSSYR